MTENTKHLTTGNPTKNLVNLAAPTMLGFLFQMLFDLVNIGWIGHMSSKAVAGVTIFTTMFMLVNVLNEIIGTSSVSLITQSFGRNDSERTSLCIEQTFVFKALVAIIAGIIFFVLLKPLLGFFTTDPEVKAAALSYGYLRIFFLPIMFSSYTVNTALRCLGNAKLPMKIMMYAALLNLILDPFLMFDIIPGTSIRGLGLGVFGAGLATVITVSCAFIYGFSLILRGKTPVVIRPKMLFKLNWEIDYKLLTIGLPNGVEVLLRNLVGIFTLKLVTTYGTEAVAAIGIGGRLFEFAFMPLVGLAMAGSTIVGQCLGEENTERAKLTAKLAAAYGASIMAVVAIIIIIFPEQLMSLFTRDQGVIEIATTMLRVIMPGFIFAGVLMGLGSVFSGSGHNTPYLISSILGRWGVQIPLLWLMVKVWALPVGYIWISYLLADFVEMMAITVAYKRGTWLRMRV